MNNMDDPTHPGRHQAHPVLKEIDDLPDQLWRAWEQAQSLRLPAWAGIRQVLLCGVGGSAMAGELLQAYAALRGPVPVAVWRDYDLPAWASGPESLVVLLSHSGEEEEVHSSLGRALERGCRCLIVGAGGELAQVAQKVGAVYWSYPDEGRLYEPLGWMFGFTAAALFRLGLLPEIGTELTGAVQAMRQQQASLRAEVPAIGNPARRMAGQMMGRWVTMIGSGMLAPVARHWQNQITRLAKTWVQVEFLPEMDHTLLGSVLQPDSMLSSTMIVFLRGSSGSPRNQLRGNLTKQAFMLEGLGTDFVDAAGETPLAQQWTSLHFGNYTAYYLAVAYGVDPAPSPAIELFMREMAAAGK
jgi:glucose/mannose-6-phosphate isomerase